MIAKQAIDLIGKMAKVFYMPPGAWHVCLVIDVDESDNKVQVLIDTEPLWFDCHFLNWANWDDSLPVETLYYSMKSYPGDADES